MKISITKEDISRGRRGSKRLCPVALSIKRKTGNRNVMVCRNAAYISDEIYNLSRASRNFIQSFDHCRPVKPINIIIKKSEG